MKLMIVTVGLLAMAACAPVYEETPPRMDADMLASPQMEAASRVRVPAGYGPGAIGYDADNCAVLRATNAAGQVFEEALRDTGGRPICVG